MAGGRDWEGTVLCAGKTANGLPCSNLEIDGLDYCLQHVPDDMLEEAETITGLHRCHWHLGEEDACHNLARGNTTPPACKNHGANLGSNITKAAMTRDVEDRVAERLAALLTENPDVLYNPPGIADPLTELLSLAAEVKAFKEIMKAAIMQLQSFRYTRDRIGEQIRAEVLLFERAQERLGHMLIQIAKLDIHSQLARIEQTKIDLIERAIDRGLNEVGADLELQHRVRAVVVRELTAA